MRSSVRAAVCGALTVIALAAVPATASAETGRDFGRHVSDHARSGMLGGDHNPGMHQGFAGWPGCECG